MLSHSPPIFFVKHWMDDQLRLQSCMAPLFNALAKRRAYFICSWRWWIEDPKQIALWKRVESRHRRRFSGHRFIHLCNTPRQWELFEQAGLEALFCNQNCLIDERIYRPLPDSAKRFDAVYDARPKSYKRHELAEAIESLALLYSFDPEIDRPDEVARLATRLPHAHFFNHDPAGAYQPLDSAAVNEKLNLCRVGLCLSHREGAMYASMQYLLSGLPVVSTASEGGRDVFFDDSVATIVAPNPCAVRDAVTTWLERDVDPAYVRAATMKKVEAHRERFIELIQSIYDQEGANRSFRSEWAQVFFDKLFVENQSHEAILSRICAA